MAKSIVMWDVSGAEVGSIVGFSFSVGFSDFTDIISVLPNIKSIIIAIGTMDSPGADRNRFPLSGAISLVRGSLRMIDIFSEIRHEPEIVQSIGFC